MNNWECNRRFLGLRRKAHHYYMYVGRNVLSNATRFTLTVYIQYTILYITIIYIISHISPIRFAVVIPLLFSPLVWSGYLEYDQNVL